MERCRLVRVLALLALASTAGAKVAFAADPAPVPNPVVEEKATEEDDFVTRRYEPAAFPVLGGNSDIGFQFGAAATLSRFADGVVPYRWNMDLFAAASIKGAPGGLDIEEQSYIWDIDVPGLAGGRLRVNPFIEYRRTANEGYFGIGNASSAAAPPGSSSRYFQYIHQETGGRLLLRYELVGPLYLLSSTSARYVNPTPYPGSKLAEDASSPAANGSPLAIGVHAQALLSEGAGLFYDTRDSEIFTRDGWLDQIGARFTQGVPASAGLTFGEAEVTVARYARLGGPFVLAVQGAVDLKFGHVPFYELFTGGVFTPDYMIGGSAAIRGVPFGRYLGPIKGVGKVELRDLLFRVHVLGQSFRLGTELFFDTGRVWSDYTFRSPLDGRGVGLKWGSGGGVYLVWGQAALFRFDIAYSPDAVAENPGFPFGVYFEDGLSF